MIFRTEIKIDEPSFFINPEYKITALGSCFAENIGNKIKEMRFNIVNNPFGVLYNPYSVFKAVLMSLNETELEEKDIVYNQGEYHSFNHHSDYSHHKKEIFEKQCYETNLRLKKSLIEADVIIITYGTSVVYEFNKTREIVSNCHKLPQSEFTKRRLTLEETIKIISDTISLIRKFNKNSKFIFSISPIRYLKEGFHNNQLSKSVLLLGTDNAINNFLQSSYFPAYEIVTDDLRDYRFFKDNLISPNQFAIEYIWEKFSETYFTNDTKEYISYILKLNKMFCHKPRNIFSDEHKKFLNFTLNFALDLISKYSFLENDENLNNLINQIKNYKNTKGII